MNDIPGFQAPFQSFFSGELYRQVARNWKGIGFLYLSLVTLLCVVLSFTFLMLNMSSAVDRLFTKMPGVKIDANSKLSIDKPSPYVINLDIPGETNKIVFDTGGKAKSLEDAEGAILLVTQDELIMKDSVSGESKTSFKDSGIKDWTLSAESLGDLKKMMGNVIIAVMAAIGALTFLGHYFLALIYAGIGMIMSSITNAKLTYGAALRVTCVAMTPAMLISMLLWCTGQWTLGQWWGFLSIPMTLGYIYFGCASAAKES